jgi:hypothetical protein
MYIPEYRRIQKDGKTIVSESSDHNLVENFVEQMQNRGLTCFCAFVDRNKAKENDKLINEIIAEQQARGEHPDSEEYIIADNQIIPPGLVDWSEGFTDEDMMEIVMSYTSKMPKRMRLKFISMLSTMMMNEVIYSEPLVMDDEDLYDDEYVEFEEDGEFLENSDYEDEEPDFFKDDDDDDDDDSDDSGE